MAITVASIKVSSIGDRYLATATLALDSSYPTGGESLTPAMLGLRVIDHIIIPSRGGVVFDYDYTNSKVMCYVPGVTVGAAGAATLDDYPVSGVASTSTISVSLDNAAGAGTHRFGIMKEVASTANLSTITGIRLIAIGA